MVPETLMERPLWIGSIEETESEHRLFQQNRSKPVTPERLLSTGFGLSARAETIHCLPSLLKVGKLGSRGLLCGVYRAIRCL